jgi:membrane fusion protein, heavy metal efflux system
MKLINKLYILLLLPFVFACKSNGAKEGGETKADTTEHHHEELIELTAIQTKTAGIELGSIEMRQLSGAIKATGMLDVPPQNLVSITSTLGGFLQSTELLQGMRVKKGQVIAVMKSTDFIQLQQDYLENVSQLEFLDAEYKRQQQLAKENVNAQKTLQQAKADYEGTKARVNGLKAKLQIAGASFATLDKGEINPLISIISPINGYVTQVNASLGAFVAPGTEMFRIVDTEHLHAEIRVYERDLPKVKLGNLVYFNLAHENANRKAHVYLIGREIETDRTIRVHCHLDKEDAELLPGMYITATLETQSGNVPALPNDAITTYENKKYVFTYKGSRKEDGEDMNDYEMIEITTGLGEFGYTEVQLPVGVDGKDLKIVTKGAYALLSKKFNSEEDGHGH